jgi:hypothetical protein
VTAVAFMGLDRQQVPHASVVTRTLTQIGGSFGTAVLAVILSSAVNAHDGSLAHAFDIAFWWATGFSAVAVLLELWLPAAPRGASPTSAEASASASAIAQRPGDAAAGAATEQEPGAVLQGAPVIGSQGQAQVGRPGLAKLGPGGGRDWP